MFDTHTKNETETSSQENKKSFTCLSSSSNSKLTLIKGPAVISIKEYVSFLCRLQWAEIFSIMQMIYSFRWYFLFQELKCWNEILGSPHQAFVFVLLFVSFLCICVF